MPGFDNNTVYADNVDFRGVQPIVPQIVTDGQLLIGATVTPHIRAGTLTSTDGSILITPGAGTLNLQGISSSNDLHITPFIVSSSGFANGANYTTIQSAINAANSAGGGMVYIQPGTYTENLIFFDQVQLVSVEYINAPQTTIVGLHTPPNTGAMAIRGIVLQSATHIFSSVAAGSSTISLLECRFNITNGFIFNLPNWTGTGFNINDCGELSTNNGVLNNSGGASFFSNNCQIGAGTLNTFTANGNVRLDLTYVNCPITISAGTIFANFALFGRTLIISGTATGTIFLGNFFPASGPAITMSSSANISIFQSTINSSNNPAISGSGSGILTYADIVFLGNANISGTLTLATTSWQPYARAIAATDATKVGTAAFNSAQFTVDTNGFVTANATAMTWTDITSATQALLVNNGYITDRSAGVTYTLPATASLGDEIIILGKLGITSIAQNANQAIRMSNALSTTGTGGSVVGTNVGDCITLRCTTAGASTIWVAESWVGSWTVT
jgi:hypothetical protein